MFTGIIEEVGRVLQAGSKLRIAAQVVMEDLVLGGSIAVNGVCLTAVQIGEGFFEVDLAPETLRRSNLGQLASGMSVNLERPVTLQQRLSGHLVQGHVDATGTILNFTQLPEGNWWLQIQVPPDLLRYVVQKGSITLNGISLTVAELKGETLSAAIIPHTYEHTALHIAAVGHLVNIECDVLAKHVERLMNARSVAGLSGVN